MKVRLRDWASLNCISERTVQVHIKENHEALEGHIERKGKQGTWLDDFAQEFLTEKIQLPNRKEVYQPTARENALMIQLNEVALRLAAAEQRAAENAGVAALLESSNAERDRLQAERDRLIADKAKAEAERDSVMSENNALKVQNASLSAENEVEKTNTLEAKNNAQKASEELTAARAEIDKMKKASLWQRIRGWKE